MFKYSERAIVLAVFPVLFMLAFVKPAVSQPSDQPGWAKYRAYVNAVSEREIDRARQAEIDRQRASGVAVTALPPRPRIDILSFAEMAEQAHDPRFVLVRFRSATASLNALASLGYQHESTLSVVPGLRRLYVPNGVAMQDTLEALNSRTDVLYAEPDYRTQSTRVPNDPQVGGANAWWLQQIRAYAAWDIATDARAIGPISVFDDGVDNTHEDLTQNMWVNPDEIAGNGIDDDNNGYVDDVHGINVLSGSLNHGTPVAGTICGQGNNGLGSAGSAWRCQLMNVRSIAGFDNTVAAVVEGFGYALAEGSRLSNHSWRVFTYSQALADVVNTAEQNGHLVIAAAGNEANDIDAENVNYPARLPNDNVITIAASQQGDTRISYSSYGATSVDLASPTEFVSSYPGNTYGGFSGTSQATPVVTGAIALLWAQVPNWSVAQVRQHVLENVRPVASWSGLTVTGGILDMQAMMQNLSRDNDGDGIEDDQDPDDDNDGVPDVDDDFPLDPSETTDSDGDGIGDNADTDDDNDNVSDDEDAFPLDPDESADSDADGVGDNADTDDDNDGIADASDGINQPSDYLDNFESNAGWTNNPDGNDTATTGIWQVGNPEQTLNGATIVQRDDTTSGVRALVTHAAAGSSLGEFDVDNGKTSTLSSVIPVPSRNPVLRFNYYLAHLNNASADDYFRVSIRVGGNTTNILDERGSAVDNGGQWKPFSVDLSQFADQNIRILVEAADAGTPSLVEAAMDDLSITGQTDNSDDGDGIAARLDLDSDNDGLWDSVEAGGTDTDNDGFVDDPADRGSITNPADNDGDGIPNHLDLESNNAANDGTAFDIARSGFSGRDSNGDGRINSSDTNGGTDADGDGIDDLIDSDPTTPGSPGSGGGVRLSINDATVSESAGFAVLTVSLSRAANRAVSVTAFTRRSDSTATPGEDFYGLTETVEFAVGESSKQLRVQIIDDTEAEGVETIAVRLLDASGGTIADDLGEITINDNDGGSSALSVTDLSVDESVGSALVTVSLAPASSSPVSVTAFTRADGSAVPGQDLYGATETIEFAAGQTSKTFAVQILDDSESESDETFSVMLTDAVGATIEDSTAVVTITDDDASGDSVLSVADLNVSEGDGTAAVTVSLSPAASGPVSVTAFTRQTGQAVPGSDYYGTTRVIEFAVGETSKTLAVEILDDTVSEGSESFDVRLSDPVGAQIGDDTATVSIGDDDGSVASLRVSSVTVDEGAGAVSVEVSLSEPVAATVTAFTRSGTAEGGGVDFYGKSRNYIFNAGGATSRLLTFDLIDDALAEGTEELTIVLIDAVGAEIAIGTGTVTINDND